MPRPVAVLLGLGQGRLEVAGRLQHGRWMVVGTRQGGLHPDRFRDRVGRRLVIPLAVVAPAAEILDLGVLGSQLLDPLSVAGALNLPAAPERPG